MNLNKKNNIKLKIINSLSPSSNLLIVENGNLLGNDFLETEEDKRFLLTLIKFSGTAPIQIEIIRVLSKTGNNLKIERAVEETPLNYNATESSRLAYEFNSGDYVFMNLTASEINGICEEIKKINNRISTLNSEKDSINNEILALKNNKFQGIKINPGEDLNNIITPGFYYNRGNIESDQILNHPKNQFTGKLFDLWDSAFALLVYEASGVIQEFISYNLHYRCIRRFYDNNWTEWQVTWIRNDGVMKSKAHAIAIGDPDTGIAQETDGALGIYANNYKVAEINHAGIYSNRPQANSGNSLVRKDYVDKNISDVNEEIYKKSCYETIKASSDILKSFNEEISQYGSNLFKFFNIYISGNIYIRFEAKREGGNGYNSKVRILKNDSLIREVNIERHQYNSYEVYVEVKTGDQIKIRNFSDTVYIRNIQICGTITRHDYII